MATFASFSFRLAERVAAFDPAWRWAVGAYLATRLLYTLWSLVVVWLNPSVLQNLDLFGAPVVVSFNLATGERFVYSRAIENRLLTFRPLEDGMLTDQETQSAWSLHEARAIAGELAGKKLAPTRYTGEDVFPYRGVKPESEWFGVWQRFDVLWYQAIAERGYGATAGDIHFPPLYPALESLVGRLLGGRFFLAGWLISQIALIGSFVLLYRLTAHWRDVATARRAVVFLILFPTAFFFFTAYSESLFLLWVLLCFSALERRAWMWAGLWAFLAVLTRLQGIALLAPLAYCAWQGWRKARLTPEIPWAQIGMLALPIAAGVFYLVLRVLVGEGFVVPTHEPLLNARLAPPWDNLVYAVKTMASGKFLMADLLNLIGFLIAFFILARGWRELPLEYSLFVVTTLVVASMRLVDTQPLNSMTRYVLTCFPLFMLLAAWSTNRWVERALVYLSLPLNLYLTAQFLTWGWVA